MAAFSILKWQNSLQEKQVELTERYEGLPLYPKMAYSLCVIIAHIGVFIGVRYYVFFGAGSTVSFI